MMSITFIGGVTLSFVGGKLADLVSDISIVYIVIAIIALCASSAAYVLSSD
jgi:nitrate/nitrite transporter NarK